MKSDAELPTDMHVNDPSCLLSTSMESFILLSTRVNNAGMLETVAHDMSQVILYDWETSTPEQLVEMCKRKIGQSQRIKSLALVTAGEPGEIAITSSLKTTLDSLATSAGSRTFWRSLADEVVAPGGDIDLLLSNVDASAEGKTLIAELEAMTLMNFTVSNGIFRAMHQRDLYFSADRAMRWTADGRPTHVDASATPRNCRTAAGKTWISRLTHTDDYVAVRCSSCGKSTRTTCRKCGGGLCLACARIDADCRVSGAE